MERGCSGCIYSRSVSDSDERAWAGMGLVLIRVRDTLRGLQELAARYRKRFRIPVVAVTGSNGKTTTKEMIRAAASSRFSVLCNEGTINNHIGVPITLLRLERGHTLAVLEMGMNARGEIRRLAEIAGPDIGVITNVGSAHLEFLGSLENVASAKSELLEVMAGSGRGERVAVLNADDPFVAAMAGKFGLRVRTFGTGHGADVRAEGVEQVEGGLRMVMNFRHTGRRVIATVPAVGVHNARNALAAAATCELLGVDPREIADSLGGVKMPPMRMEISRLNGITVINDAYNANPASTVAAIETLEGMGTRGRRIFVMGDMLELGPVAPDAHRDIGRRVASGRVDLFITVGELASLAAKAARQKGMARESAITCTDAAGVAAVVREKARPGDLVLLKASRMVGLEAVLREMEG